MGEMLIFDYMNKDNVLAHVEIEMESKQVKCIKAPSVLTNQFLEQLPHTFESMIDILEDRCFSRNHHSIDRILGELGLTEYDPLEIIKITHGAMMHDCNWIRFNGETLTYRDITVRGDA